MKIVTYQSFKRAFKRLIKKNTQLQDRILRIIALLENAPFTPLIPITLINCPTQLINKT